MSEQMTNAEIDKAISILEENRKADAIATACEGGTVPTPFMAAADLAIQALRQMRTEPCEWCDTVLTLFTHSGKFIPENQPPRNYCPSCGRKLKGE